MSILRGCEQSRPAIICRLVDVGAGCEKDLRAFQAAFTRRENQGSQPAAVSDLRPAIKIVQVDRSSLFRFVSLSAAGGDRQILNNSLLDRGRNVQSGIPGVRV